MLSIGFPETSVRNYRCTVSNIPGQRRSHLFHGRSLQSRKVESNYSTLLYRTAQSITHGDDSSRMKKNTRYLYGSAVPTTAAVSGILNFNPLKPELNPIGYLLALLGAHHFLHVSRIRVKLLTLRRLMSYIYGAPILDVSRSHTTTQHSR